MRSDSGRAWYCAVAFSWAAGNVLVGGLPTFGNPATSGRVAPKAVTPVKVTLTAAERDPIPASISARSIALTVEARGSRRARPLDDEHVHAGFLGQLSLPHAQKRPGGPALTR